MKLNSLPNFRVEDFESEKAWIGRLFVQLNPFVQSVNQVLDQNIDYASNLKAVTREYTITTFQEFSFQWPFSGSSPADLRVIQAAKGTTLTPTALLPVWSYDATSTTVTIHNLLEATSSGVAAVSGRYKFTLRATV